MLVTTITTIHIFLRFFFYSDASIQRLSVLQLSDCRYKHRLNYPTTLLEQFLRGKGLQAGLWSLFGNKASDASEVQWKNALLPLVNCIGQLL